MTKDNPLSRRMNGVRSIEVRIPPLELSGTLQIPDAARGIVIFAHGSGSGRLSPRNVYVADCLNEAGFATLLFDLLTGSEEADRRNVFDIALLAQRLGSAVGFVLERQDTGAMPIGLVRGQHRGCGGARRCRVARGCTCRRLPGRPPGPRRRGQARGGARAGLPHRRRKRPRGPGTQPLRDGAHLRSRRTQDRARCHTSVSRSRCA